MITRSLEVIFIILLISFANTNMVYGQIKPSSQDTICVKYVFWSSPKYSLNCTSELSRTNNNLTTFLKHDFKDLFLPDTEEFKYLKKAERKLVVGNFAFALPAGVLFGLVLTGEYDKSTNTVLVIGGSTLCLLDISIGLSSFKDLKKAVRKRNNRILTFQ